MEKLQVIPMTFKQNTIVCFNHYILRIKRMVELAFHELLPGIGPVCSSGMDGAHSKTSGHYEGRSLDIRIWNIPAKLRKVVAKAIKKKLGRGYYVQLEADHIHVQRNKGTVK